MRQEVKRLKDQIALQTREIAQLIARQRRRDRVHRCALIPTQHVSLYLNILYLLIAATIIITADSSGTSEGVFASFRY